jgi:hypothetical protein
MKKHRLLSIAIGIAVAVGSGGSALAQEWTPLKRGSDNIEVLGHIPLGHPLSVADMDVEQELDRPYAYVARMIYGDDGPKGTDIISLADPERPELLYEWRIENEELHLPRGGMDVKHFKLDGRYYLVQSTQFGQGGPNYNLGAVVLDVTDLPDPTSVREVARIYDHENPGGFHNIFIYKHSNGGVYLFTTSRGPYARVYDLAKVVAGDVDDALAGLVPVPATAGPPGSLSYHDFYVGYHPDTDDDVTDLTDPQLRITLTGISGVSRGHTFTPSPDGRYVIAEVEYQYAPIRVFDLKPALDGEVTNVSRPISAFTADWKNLIHNHEVRWPFVFASGYLDGLQIFNLMDPQNPALVGYYDTYIGPPNTDQTAVFNGAFGIDVRNADGLIVVSDMSTGLWTFRMDGFQGWNGEDWGLPDISSAQKWDEPVKKRGPISQ